MATKAIMDPEPNSIGTTTPEYLSLKDHYADLIRAVKTQVGTYADELFSRDYISSEVLEYTRTTGIVDSDKARKLMDSVIDRIKLNPALFHGFVKIVKSDTVVKKLQDSHKRKIPNKESAIPHVKQPGFECPSCGECSIEQYLSVEGCPKRSSERKVNIFPYLRTGNLDDNKRAELEKRLRTDTKKMILSWNNIICKIAESFEEQQVSLDKVKLAVLSLGAFAEGIGVELLNPADRQKIEVARNITTVFITLTKYTSFFNYEIVEHLIETFGSSEDCKMWQKYLDDFNKFCNKCNVFEVPSDILSSGVQDSTTATKIFVPKCTENMANLKGVHKFRQRIADIFGLKIAALRLCSIKDGCLELHFLISSRIIDVIYPVSPDVQSVLKRIGVREIFCRSMHESNKMFSEDVR